MSEICQQQQLTSRARVLQGGIKAVVWTDVLQMLLMIAGFMMVFLTGILDRGGLANIFNESKRYGLMEFE